jgi:hypothetical protein
MKSLDNDNDTLGINETVGFWMRGSIQLSRGLALAAVTTCNSRTSSWIVWHNRPRSSTITSGVPKYCSMPPYVFITCGSTHETCPVPSLIGQTEEIRRELAVQAPKPLQPFNTRSLDVLAAVKRPHGLLKMASIRLHGASSSRLGWLRFDVHLLE